MLNSYLTQGTPSRQLREVPEASAESPAGDMVRGWRGKAGQAWTLLILIPCSSGVEEQWGRCRVSSLRKDALAEITLHLTRSCEEEGLRVSGGTAGQQGPLEAKKEPAGGAREEEVGSGGALPSRLPSCFSQLHHTLSPAFSPELTNVWVPDGLWAPLWNMQPLVGVKPSSHESLGDPSF